MKQSGLFDKMKLDLKAIKEDCKVLIIMKINKKQNRGVNGYQRKINISKILRRKTYKLWR